MYTCQCKGLQMGQSSGVLFKEVSAFQRCPFMEVLLYITVMNTPTVCSLIFGRANFRFRLGN